MAVAMRRVPLQERSREKVRRILDAAEELLIDVGYEAAVISPVLLVERSGVSRGAFYNFFASPEGVMETLALRVIDDLKKMTDELVTRPFDSWEQASDAVIETYLVFYRNPAVRQLWLRDHMSTRAAEADQHLNTYISQRLRELFERVTDGRIDTDPVRWRVAVELFDYVLRLAFRYDPAGNPAVIHEAKIALRSYLATFASPGLGRAAVAVPKRDRPG
jgi:AcrR family transcriptional regulator